MLYFANETITQKIFQIMRNKGVKNIPHPLETQYIRQFT